MRHTGHLFYESFKWYAKENVYLRGGRERGEGGGEERGEGEREGRRGGRERGGGGGEGVWV